MATNQPYAQLTGAAKVYLAPYGEAVPAVNATPAGNWVEFGATADDQEIEHGGEPEFFFDNDHQGPVKAVRPEENVMVRFNLVGLTLENYARSMSAVSRVTTAAGPPATKTLGLKRGAEPTEYALLFKGSVLSPYGAYPGMYVIPRCVQSGEPTPTFGKDKRAELALQFTALEDDTQSENLRLGWIVAQTA